MKRFWVLIAAMVLALSILPIGVEVYAANSVEEILQEDETQKSYEQAVRALRQQLVERKEVCTVTLPDNFSVEASVLFDGALAHTGVGSEGDYLRSNLDLNIKALNMIVSGTYSFTVKYRTTWEQEQIVNDLVTQLAEEIRGESNADTLNNICRYINNHCAYDQYYLDMMEGPYYYWDHPSEFNSMKQTAYGALVNKTAVCEGLSALFYRLCMETGIDARIIYGKSGDMGHAWVIADVTGNRDYYHFDPTSSFYFMGGSISLEDGAYGELLYAPNGEYISEEFSSLYPMPDETYTFNIDYSFDWTAGYSMVHRSNHCSSGFSIENPFQTNSFSYFSHKISLLFYIIYLYKI